MSESRHNSRRRSLWAAITSSVRSTFGGGLTLTLRRARRDALLILVWVGLLAFVLLLSIGAPWLTAGTLDAGAREAVTVAGPRADLVVHIAVGQPAPVSSVVLLSPDDLDDAVAAARERLPAGIASVLERATTAVISEPLVASKLDSRAVSGGTATAVTLGMLTTQNTPTVSVVSGRLPAATDDPTSIEVVLSQAGADAASVGLGSTITIDSTPSALTMKVVGIIAVPSESASVWTDLPTLLDPAPATTPSDVSTRPTPAEIGVVTNAAGVSAASLLLPDPFDGIFRFVPDPAAFTTKLATRVADETQSLSANSSELSDGTIYTFDAQSDFADALSGFPVQARAALSQLSMFTTGLLGVALAVVVLVSRFLVRRRVREIELERARGASTVSVVTRALGESVVTAGIAVLLAVPIGVLLFPGGAGPTPAFFVVAVSAALAGPVQSFFAARTIRSARRTPANRQDRVDRERGGKVRRIALEVTLVVIAAGALYSVQSRGLLQSRTAEVDPLLAAAPLLFAVAITVLALRLYVFPLRGIAGLGKRTRGPLGTIWAAQSTVGIAALPLFALTLAVALSASSLMLASTVTAGQDEASWIRVGADARVQAVVPDQQTGEVAAAPGVVAASALSQVENVQLALGTFGVTANLLAVDAAYPRVMESLPRIAGGGPKNAAAFDQLFGSKSADDALPVIVDRSISDKLLSPDIVMSIEQYNIRLRVVGSVEEGPVGYTGGPFVWVDRSALNSRIPDALEADTLLISGSGAAAAAIASGFSDEQTLSRPEWVEAQRQHALVAGVERMVVLSAIVLAILAMIALAATVLAGTRDRARSLSLLRTLGTSARVGWFLALAELVPVVGAALIGGVLGGIGILLVIGPSLGLASLTGGTLTPLPVIPPVLIAALVASMAVLLVLAVLVEFVAHRRDRLSDVLRVGETI